MSLLALLFAALQLSLAEPFLVAGFPVVGGQFAVAELLVVVELLAVAVLLVVVEPFAVAGLPVVGG